MDKLLSVCMIVKDEESVLKRCLESIKHFADEIIIVDTGSTDASREIAALFTEHVYDFTWINDFSAARNESLKYATGKWILVLDADEYINSDDAGQFRLFLKDTEVTPNRVYNISVVSYVGESLQDSRVGSAPVPRLFPNFQNIEFKRPIHEQLANANGEYIGADLSPITIYHTGYLKETILAKKKLERNQSIFTALKQKSGFTPYDYFTVGNEHSARGDTNKALYNYERALAKVTPSSLWRFHCALEIVLIYIKENRLVEAWKVVDQIFLPKSNYPELHFLRGHIYEAAGLSTLAKQCYLEAFQNAETLSRQNTNFWLVNPTFVSSVLLLKLVSISVEEQNFQEVVFYSMKLLQSNPHDYASLIRLLRILAVEENPESILNVTKKIFPENKQHDIYLLFKIFTSLGQLELSELHFKQLAEPDRLPLPDQLRFTLVREDKDQFIYLISSITEAVTQREVIFFYHLGRFIFDLETLLQIELIDDELTNYFSIVDKMISGKLDEDEQNIHTNLIWLCLTELFTLKQFNCFDKLVSHYYQPKVINLLASFFYANKMTDLAIDYFNLLADADALDAENHARFAMLHFINNLHDNGISLLKHAIALEPDNKYFYTLLMENCQDDETRQQAKSDYLTLSTQLAKLPGVDSL